ncbi:MAG: multicopper oxidase domain-containing protein [Gammaproteobacteria bacterium]|nr:multicopper oxidase domain-containing protein [Gammaproteobacteria bacterium]
MNRREFLQRASVIGATVAGSAGLLSWAPSAAAAQTYAVNLTAMSGDVTQIDGTTAFMFGFSNTGVLTVPGPTIICQAGDSILLTLSNTLNTPVVFAVPGTSIKLTTPANGSLQFAFAAPAPGSYLYCDDQNSGVNRVMGLHGSLVVMPLGIKNQAFTAGPKFKRQFKWLLGNVDPVWGNAVKANGDNYVKSIVASSFLPRYFTINGNSFDKTHEPNTDLYGLYGEPALVRLMNAGGMVHSPHFHGNHVEICSINRTNFSSNRLLKDVVSMYPLDCRDVIFPFIQPPDAWPPITVEPQNYPMHCHSEMSQTAGGGMYPHGLHCAMGLGKLPLVESDLTLGVAALP